MLARPWLLSLLCAACAATPPSAQEASRGYPSTPPEAREGAQVALSFEGLEVFDGRNIESGSIEVRMPEGPYDLQPMLGFTLAEDEANYLYGGLRWNLRLSDRLRISPGFAAGYFSRGNLLDLGLVLEFRSSVEISWPLGPGRVAFEVYHLSNGSLSDRNPGTEGLVLRYMFDLP